MVKQTMIFSEKEFRDYLMNIVPNLSNVYIDDKKNIVLVHDISLESIQSLVTP